MMLIVVRFDRDLGRAAPRMSACHELRNPLHAVSAILDDWKSAQDMLVPEMKADVDSLASLASSMVRLVNDVLDLARINDGSLTLAFEPVGRCDASLTSLFSRALHLYPSLPPTLFKLTNARSCSPSC